MRGTSTAETALTRRLTEWTTVGGGIFGTLISLKTHIVRKKSVALGLQYIHQRAEHAIHLRTWSKVMTGTTFFPFT